MALLQSGTELVKPMVAPVQKTNDSGMAPVRSILSLVLAATVPVSIAARKLTL